MPPEPSPPLNDLFRFINGAPLLPLGDSRTEYRNNNREKGGDGDKEEAQSSARSPFAFARGERKGERERERGVSEGFSRSLGVLTPRRPGAFRWPWCVRPRGPPLFVSSCSTDRAVRRVSWEAILGIPGSPTL